METTKQTRMLMECGHVAQGTFEGKPACVICFLTGPALVPASSPAPSLAGRRARCSYNYKGGQCKSEMDSSWDLAFFEYLGPRSHKATIQCGACGYYLIAHSRQPDNVDPRSVVELGRCKGFVPHGPFEFDEYYCGCWGWD